MSEIMPYLDKRLDRIEDKLDEKLSVIEIKVDKLFQFKWQIIGGSIAISTVFSIITTLVLIYLKAS